VTSFVRKIEFSKLIRDCEPFLFIYLSDAYFRSLFIVIFASVHNKFANSILLGKFVLLADFAPFENPDPRKIIAFPFQAAFRAVL